VKSGPGASKTPILGEKVTDCGPAVDLQKSAGCKLVPKAELEEGAALPAYPDCCPVYDCENPDDVVYVSSPKSTKITKSARVPKEGSEEPRALEE